MADGMIARAPSGSSNTTRGWFAFIACSWLVTMGVITAGCREVQPTERREIVTINGETFRLEVADTDATREKGLMGRTEIPHHGGMIFIFPDVQLRSFWMKNCLVDMDLIFLDPGGRVTATHRMVALPPQRPDESEIAYDARMRQTSFLSGLPAQFAIELQSGWLDRLNLSVDDRIELDLPRLKASVQ